MGMTITFQFRKDYTGDNEASPGTQISFKKNAYVTGEVVDSGTPDPTNYIIITNTDGRAKVPFGGKSYQGENAILESPTAPWLGQTKVDTTPRGDFNPTDLSSKLEAIPIPVKIAAGVLLILIIILIVYYIKKLRKKS
jgi:hypothetical protein